MKKLINRPEAVVSEMIEGLVAIDPALERLPGQTVVIRADAATVRDRRVALISGGGSGHEPAHAGYVGPGMLSAAVAGDVFTSPGPDAVLAAIRAVAGRAGVLLIVKNYSGDRLNFGLAAEMARADGIAVEVVIVADDVALAATTENAGRRGLAGTVFVHKVAGAAAEAGASLAEVAAEARDAARSVGTMGVALTPCTVPAAGTPGFTLGGDEIELGLGIHGEPGVRRGPLEPADVLVDRLLNAIIADGRPLLDRGSRVALLVNNLGATPTMELYVVARRAVIALEARGILLERIYVGTFLSALEMAGVSLSLVQVDDRRLARLDAPTGATAWPKTTGRRPRSRSLTGSPAAASTRPGSDEPTVDFPVCKSPRTGVGRAIEAALRAATRALKEAAPRLTAMDQAVGDGDLGISLERGAQAIEHDLATSRYPLDDPASTLRALGLTTQRAVGGTSGALYSIFFVRAATRLRSGSTEDPMTWADAFKAGAAAIAELGGARPGDRTMLDALLPAADAFRLALDAGQPLSDALSASADAARIGAEATAAMSPRRGRSSYLGDRALGHPDPGAEAVALWLRAIASVTGE
jgi:triose/dihydroxyacetone kinase / FAD-AMP lyase (cyclizing)